MSAQGCDAALIGSVCETWGCRASAGTVLEAADSEYCRFVGWQGACGSERQCLVSAGAGPMVAVFERVAWPLDLVFEAPFVEVSLRPGTTRVAATTRLPVAVGATYRLEPVAAVGRRPVLSGDCRWEAGMCWIDGDRSREVRVGDEVDTVDLEVEVAGQGEVVVAERRCGPAATCTIAVVRGQLVTLEALPAAGHAFVGWSRGECAGARTCQVRVDSTMRVQARFVPLRTLALEARGPAGRVEVNAVSHALPVSLVFPDGTDVQLKVRPAPDDTVEAIDGLPCATPRRVDECGFALRSDQAGSVRFHRLFQWVTGGVAGVRYGPPAQADAGVVLGLFYDGLRDPLRLTDGGTAINSATVRIELDGGSSFAPLAILPSVAGSPRPFFVMQDGEGSWWAILSVAAGERLAWAGVDAGLEVARPTGVLAGRLDEALRPLPLVRQFNVTDSDRRVFVVPPWSRPEVAPASVVMGAYLAPTVSDGGALPQGFVISTADLATSTYVGLGVGNQWPAAVSSDGDQHWAASQAWGLGNSAAPCGRPVGTSDALVISRFDGAGACQASALASSQLPGEFSRPLWLERAPGGLVVFADKRTSAGLAALEFAEFDNALLPRWRKAIRPGATSLTLGGFLGRPIFKNVDEFWLVSLWRTPAGGLELDAAGLAVRCEGDQTSSLLLTRHDRRFDGRATWGVCLTDPSMNSRFDTMTSGVVSLGQGLLLGLRPNVGAAASRDFAYGSQLLPVQSGGEVLLYLTPP